MGVVRVGAVLTGVLVAIGVSTWVGLTWWSVAMVIALSLNLAVFLRLGDQALETPISAMLILAVGGQEIAAETRVLPLGLSRRNDLPRTRGTQSLDEPRLYLLSHGSGTERTSATIIGAGRSAKKTVASIREHVRQRATVGAELQRNR